MARIIAHIDINAFFAKAEELRDPSLKGQAIIVGGLGPRGVVSTANYEARKYGVHSAMPIVEARRKCPHGIFKNPDFRYYEMLSRSFFAFLRNYTPLVESASIDEGYLDLSGVLKNNSNPVMFFRNLQAKLKKEIGLEVSIGVGPTKFLAKMGSDYKKPLGLTIIRKKDIPSLLYPLPIDRFYGIGKKTAPRLLNIGIQTIGDLEKALGAKDPTVQEILGKFFLTADEWIHGRGEDKIVIEEFAPKSLGHGETFPLDTSDYHEIKEKIYELTARVAYGLHNERLKCRTITLSVKDSDFHTHAKAKSFQDPSDDPQELSLKALDLFLNNFLGMNIRYIGVSSSNLINPKEETVQMNFWNYQEYEKMDETKLLISSLNRRLKEPSLIKASDLTHGKKQSNH